MVIEKIRSMVLELCGNPDHDLWKWHIESVVKYSKKLGKELNADEEILEISAWLHDIQKIRDDNRDTHHIEGAEEAESTLRDLEYPEERIQRVKHCILTHSSDNNYPPESKEAEILHNADSLSHFDNLMGFAHWVYWVDGLPIEEGRKVLIHKYEKAWRKLTIPEAREYAREKYNAVMLLLKGEEQNGKKGQ